MKETEMREGGNKGEGGGEREQKKRCLQKSETTL